jgi:hypothetical protein
MFVRTFGRTFVRTFGRTLARQNVRIVGHLHQRFAIVARLSAPAQPMRPHPNSIGGQAEARAGLRPC